MVLFLFFNKITKNIGVFRMLITRKMDRVLKKGGEKIN